MRSSSVLTNEGKDMIKPYCYPSKRDLSPKERHHRSGGSKYASPEGKNSGTKYSGKP
jgi:hypothetical protein